MVSVLAPERKLTAKQTLARAEALQRLAALKGAQFAGDTDAKRLRRMAEAVVLPERFNRTYLGHYFRDEGSPYQAVLYLALEWSRRIASRVPRGCGKTTVTGRAYITHQVVCAPVLRAWREGRLQAEQPELHAAIREVMAEESARRIAAGPLTCRRLGLPEHWDPTVEARMDAWLEDVYRRQCAAEGEIPLHWDPYIQWIGVTIEEACDVMLVVEAELARNPLLRSDWGDLTPCLSGDWGRQVRRAPSIDDWESNGVRVRAYGMEKAIRGGTHGPWRPTLALFDDPDSERTVQTLGQRNRNLDTAIGAVQYGLEPATGRVMVNGTPHHPDAVICRLTEQEAFSDWTVVRFRIQDERGLLLYPQRWPADAIRLARASSEERYESELGDRPPSLGGRPVRQLHYYDVDAFAATKLPKVMAFDPSLGKTGKSDFQALVCLRGPTPQGWFLVHRVELLRIADPLLLAQRLDEIYAEESPDLAVIEAISLGHWIEMLATTAGKASQTFATWVRIERQTEAKDIRIRGLAPAVNDGTIRFPADHRFRQLERQWLDYGDSGSKRDGPDVTEMAFRYARPQRPGGRPGDIRHGVRESRFDPFRRIDQGFGRRDMLRRYQ